MASNRDFVGARKLVLVIRRRRRDGLFFGSVSPINDKVIGPRLQEWQADGLVGGGELPPGDKWLLLGRNFRSWASSAKGKLGAGCSGLSEAAVPPIARTSPSGNAPPNSALPEAVVPPMSPSGNAPPNSALSKGEALSSRMLLHPATKDTAIKDKRRTPII